MFPKKLHMVSAGNGAMFSQAEMLHLHLTFLFTTSEGDTEFFKLDDRETCCFIYVVHEINFQYSKVTHFNLTVSFQLFQELFFNT